MNSQDYHAHISRVSRMPSVLSDVPQYPNAHVAFNNNNNNRRRYMPEERERERVEVIEETKVVDNYGNVVYREEEVDVETDEYNTSRRNNGGGFNLCKWKTFRP